MTPITHLRGKKVALFGLGGSGVATARALMAGGAEVACWDDGEAARMRALASGMSVVDLKSADWSQFAALILAPGVPLTHPAPHWTVVAAQAAGVEVIGDIELFCRERALIAKDAPFIAITGTNGKSTTTALIAHILREAGHDVQLGGNIGMPILELAPPSQACVHVIECSSFQIDLAPSLNPSIGVLLNITPDHLDRHGTMENYAAVKERLVQAADAAVIGIDDEYCRAILSRRKGKVAAISKAESSMSQAISYRDGKLMRNGVVLADLATARALRGAHNGQNAAAAFAACEFAGLSADVIRTGLASFPGLAHRMEEVGRIGSTLFINDSKATNADAAEKALLTFDSIYWIIGGKSKEGGIEPLVPLFSKVKKAYLIGASSDDFARTLKGHVTFERCGTLDVATSRAAEDAGKESGEAVVLLSPACASYDQFPNFEVRGNHFRSLVAELVARAKTN